MTSRSDASKRASALDTLESLDRAALCARWAALLGGPPPKSLSLSFMQRIVAYELQCRALGGLHGKTRARLRRIADQAR
jgi:hypothetical protein